jgi:hypothetical protein
LPDALQFPRHLLVGGDDVIESVRDLSGSPVQLPGRRTEKSPSRMVIFAFYVAAIGFPMFGNRGRVRILPLTINFELDRSRIGEPSRRRQSNQGPLAQTGKGRLNLTQSLDIIMSLVAL